MSHNFPRSIGTVLAGPAVAAGILVGTLAVSAPAQASTSSSTESSTLALPERTDAISQNPLTPAPQTAVFDIFF